MLHFKAVQWCLDNGIKFSPFPVVSNGSVLKIVKSENGNEILGEAIYNSENVYEKINELYLSIYNKNNQGMCKDKITKDLNEYKAQLEALLKDKSYDNFEEKKQDLISFYEDKINGFEESIKSLQTQK